MSVIALCDGGYITGSFRGFLVKNKSQKIVSELVYGVHPVRELLAQKKRKILGIFTLATEPKIWEQLQPLLPKYPYAVHRLSRQALSERLGTTEHQGIAVHAEPFPFRKKFFDPAREPFLVMLDGIQDVRNLGAILRSAYCTGAQGVILCEKNGVQLTPAALKASAGLAERMSIYQVSSAPVALVDLKKAGYHVYVAALSETPNAYTLEYKTPLCVIIGSEGVGVSGHVLRSGMVVTLPQKTADISYNASVAAGILLSLISHKSGLLK